MVTGSDMKLMKSAAMPTNESSTCGGAATLTEIPGSVVGEVFPPWPADLADGDDIARYQEIFLVNTNEADTATGVKVWLPCSLDEITVAGVIKAQSDNAGDGTSKKLYIISKVSGVFGYENLTLNGVTQVIGARTADIASPIRMELRDVTSGAKVAATGNITITCGDVVIGYIITGMYQATTEFKIALPATLNTTGTTTNTLTKPSALTFTKPNVEGSALSAAADMTPGDGQSIWIEWISFAGILPLADMYIPIARSGNSV